MLAVFSTQLGASFINRHVEDVYPQKTVAVIRRGGHPLGGVPVRLCPTFYIDRWALKLKPRILGRLGWNGPTMQRRAIESFLQSQRVTVVLGEFLDDFLDFVPMLESLGLPYIVQAHGIDVSQALRDQSVVAQLSHYRSAHAILTRCELHRERLVRLGLPADKVFVNHGGVDVAEHPPSRSPASSRRFLAVGRAAYKKGPLYMLEAFRLASKIDRDITLDYLGDGPLLPAIKQFVRLHRLESRIRIHGYKGDAFRDQLLTDCGIFLQHSVTDPDTGDEEGLPAAIQEAMGQAMAVVSTRHAGIPEAVSHGVSGLLVEECDVEGMAQAIIDVIPQALEMGLAGHRIAAESHRWEHERTRLRHWLTLAEQQR